MSKQAVRTPEHKATETTRKLLRQISQAQIESFQAAQLEVATLKRGLKDKEQAVDALEAAYIAMLEKGYTCEEGDLRMVLDETSRKATPKYKELYASVAGPKAVEEAQEAAGVNVTKHAKVVSGKVQI